MTTPAQTQSSTQRPRTQPQGQRKPQQKKTSPPEVREANREFLRRHPERGGRLPNPSNPNDKAAMAEWRQIYADAKKRNQPPAPKAEPSKPVLPCQANKPQCELKSMELHCEHTPEKRKYKVLLPSTDPRKRYLDVIAGNSNTKETIKVTTALAKPLCNDKKHKQRHLVVKPPFNGPEIATAQQTLKFDVKSSLVLPTAWGLLGKLKILYKHVWPSYETKDIYYVDALACTTHGPAQAQVRVFPDIQWSAEFAMSAGLERSRKSTVENGVRKIENEGGYPIGFEAKCTYKYDGDQQDISAEFKNTYVPSSALMKVIKLSAHWFRKIAYYAGNVKVTFPTMSVGFKYTSTLAENPNGPDVRRDVDLEFAADPLLGAALEVDLLELLINAAGKGAVGLGIACGPAIASFLLKAKKTLEGGVGRWGVEVKGKVALVLGMKGGIGGKGALAIRAGKVTECNGTVEGKIEFSFGGVAQLEGKFWKVETVAGVSLTGSAGFAGGLQLGCDPEGPHYGGKLYFSGAKLEFRAFAGVKISRKPAGAPADAREDNEAGGKSGWTVTWPAWPDEGNYHRHRFF